jgi:hypothetical protein
VPHENSYRRFSAKIGGEDIFRPAAWNVSIQGINYDNEIEVVNFAISKNQVFRSTVFPHHRIH